MDAGQYVQPGTPLAQIFSIQTAEVRLPVTDQELEQLGMSLQQSGGSARHQMPEVIFQGSIGDRIVTWPGRVLRTEGLYDPKTRVIHVVAHVDDPYGFLNPSFAPPLAMGMFVEARLIGRTLHDRIVLPSTTLIDGNQVWIIRDDNTLERRPVELAHAANGQVVIDRGVRSGERVYINPDNVIAEGMRVTAVPAMKTIDADQEVDR